MIHAIVYWAVGLSLWAVDWRRWKKVAARQGFELAPVKGFDLSMAGYHDGFKVCISQKGTRQSNVLLTEIDSEGRVPPYLELKAEKVYTRDLPDIETDDELFDSLARITGSEPIALAMLSHETRAALHRFLKEGGRVSRGLIIQPGGSLKAAVSNLPWLVELTRMLSLRRTDVPRALAHNAFHEQLPEVRARNFVVLQEHYQGTEVAEEALERALSSTHGELRLEAAVHRGEEGRDVLHELALNEAVELSVRLRSIERLVRPSWATTSAPVLELLLDSTADEVRRSAVVGLGRFRHRPAAAKLVALADTDRSTVRSVAEALGRIGDQRAEPTLIGLLEHDDHKVVRTAAQALGRIGTAAAVVPLMEHTGRSAPKTVRSAAREAIKRIQGRVIGADKGQLSLTSSDDLEGAVSQAEHPGHGGVSLVGEEPQTSGE